MPPTRVTPAAPPLVRANEMCTVRRQEAVAMFTVHGSASLKGQERSVSELLLPAPGPTILVAQLATVASGLSASGPGRSWAGT